MLIDEVSGCRIGMRKGRWRSEGTRGVGWWSHADGRPLEGVCLELPRQARRRAPGTEQIWRGEAEQRQAGGVRILLAALAFVHGGPLSKGNEQRDEQRERKPEREKKGKGNGVAV